MVFETFVKFKAIHSGNDPKKIGLPEVDEFTLRKGNEINNQGCVTTLNYFALNRIFKAF